MRFTSTLALRLASGRLTQRLTYKHFYHINIEKIQEITIILLYNIIIINLILLLYQIVMITSAGVLSVRADNLASRLATSGLARICNNLKKQFKNKFIKLH